ncbi:predicted Rossmann fold nucleotide-binding protein involved in DNA uptake [Firmicutes bacterium CAG:308]|nr:predicted Rossmann fold nucleotide-binding protein involved in DNA uptake [Firmicutes bacterium CAG:308]
MNEMRKAILYYAIKYQGDWNKIGQAIRSKESFQEIKISESYVTIVDEAYPLSFRQLRFPPWIIFYRGNYDLLKKRCVGIVGARNCSQKAIENATLVSQRLKQRYCIVSGLAKGIDAASHCASLDKDTIGIIGCGIDRIYPYVNKELFLKMYATQLVISEYPPGVAPYARNFPWRNRLIAALSESLIVIEATIKSGTMLTVNEMLELSKPVYCLPTAFNDVRYQGCNYLISQGANILSSEKELEYL